MTTKTGPASLTWIQVSKQSFSCLSNVISMSWRIIKMFLMTSCYLHIISRLLLTYWLTLLDHGIFAATHPCTILMGRCKCNDADDANGTTCSLKCKFDLVKLNLTVNYIAV